MEPWQLILFRPEFLQCSSCGMDLTGILLLKEVAVVKSSRHFLLSNVSQCVHGTISALIRFRLWFATIFLDALKLFFLTMNLSKLKTDRLYFSSFFSNQCVVLYYYKVKKRQRPKMARIRMVQRKGKLSYILESACFAKYLYAVFEPATRWKAQMIHNFSSHKLSIRLCLPKGKRNRE